MSKRISDKEPVSVCPMRRLPVNPGVSLCQPDGSRLSVTRSGSVARGELTELPNGFWLSDGSVEIILQSLAERRSRVVHADGWIGVSWRQIREEFGLPETCNEKHVQGLAEIAERTIFLSVMAAKRGGLANSLDEPLSRRRTFGRISLAVGMQDFVRPSLDRTRPRTKEVAMSARSSLVFGIGEPDFCARGRQQILRASRPKHSHLMWLASQPVPNCAIWKPISIDSAGEPMADSLESALQNMNRPVLIRGYFQPMAPIKSKWLRSWLRGPDSSWGRNWFILEEAAVLRRYGDFMPAEVFVGTFRPRRHRSVLNRCASELISACGNRRKTRISWSAGLASENLIRAVCQMSARRKKVPSMEAVWIAAYDRISVLEAIEAVEARGGIVVSAAAGAVSVQVEGNAHAAEIADVLWKTGLHVQAGIARRLKAAGYSLLANPDQFGGAGKEQTLAVASQLGLCGLVRKLDGFTDGRPYSSRKKIDSLEEVLAKFQS